VSPSGTEHRQKHVRRYLEEFAFPVLKGRRDEMAAGQVGEKFDRGQFMQAELLDIGLPACQGLADEGDQEERKQGE
jgi:hypothetical protein